MVLVNNPPLSHSKSIWYRVCCFGGCVGVCQTISLLSCDALLHTWLRFLGHLCPCSVSRSPGIEIPMLVRSYWAGSNTPFHQQVTAQALLALLHGCQPGVWRIPAEVPDLTSLFGAVPYFCTSHKLLKTVFMGVRHFGGKLVLSWAFVQLLTWPPNLRGPLHIAVMSIQLLQWLLQVWLYLCCHWRSPSRYSQRQVSLSFTQSRLKAQMKSPPEMADILFHLHPGKQMQMFLM